MLRTRALVASLVLTAVATACGSDSPSSQSSPSASTTPTPTWTTKEAWVAGINKICLELEADTENIGEPKTAQDFADATNELVTAMEAANAKTRALAPPPADAAVIEANFYAPNDKQAAALKAAIPDIEAAAKKKDDQAAAAAFGAAFADAFDENAEEQSTWMEQYGLKDCV